MRQIVIQDSRSFRYLSDGGTWDYEPKIARKFERVAEAEQHCIAGGLKQVHIVVGTLRPDGRFDGSSKTILHIRRVVGPQQGDAPHPRGS